MLKCLDIGIVIGMKQMGASNREIARKTGYDRNKISSVWSRYCGQVARLGEEGADVKSIQAEMTEEPKYTGRGRTRFRYTEAVEKRFKEIVEEETVIKSRLFCFACQRGALWNSNNVLR